MSRLMVVIDNDGVWINSIVFEGATASSEAEGTLTIRKDNGKGIHEIVGEFNDWQGWFYEE